MTTSASSLLDILRGHKPAPAASPSSPSAPAAASPVSSGAPPPQQPQQGNSDLDRLFQSAFNTSHPSTSPSQAAPPSPVTQGIIEQPSPPHSRSPVNGAVGGGGGGGVGTAAEASNSLLSLLQGMGAGSSPAGQAAREQEGGKQANGQGTKVEKGAGGGSEAARDLLATLMGGSKPGAEQPSTNGHSSPPPISSPPATSPQPNSQQQSTQGTVQPKFAPFISPFDLLARAHAAEQASLSPPPPLAPTTAEPTTTQQQHQQAAATRSAIPPHLLPTLPMSRPSSAASSEAYSSDGGSAAAPPPPMAKETKYGSLLASQFLSPLPSPSSPAGLSLPPSSAGELQSLTIDLSLPHLDSLSPHLPAHTPITLFPSSPSYPGAAQRVGVWARGIVYTTAKGRVRVIGREKGGRGLIKLGAGAGGVGDLQVAGGEEGRERVLACSGKEGGVGVWRVVQGEEGEVSHTPLLLLSSPPSPSSSLVKKSEARFPLLRFHPLFPSTPVLALAVNDGRVFLLDLETVLGQGAGVIEGGEELLYALGKGAQCGGSIIDLSFSPDGSALVVLLADGSYSVRRTEKPSQVVLAGQLPTEGEQGEEWSGVSFLAPTDGRPTALVVTSQRGTVARLIPLAASPSAAAAASTISLLLPTTTTEQQQIDPQTHFSHQSYHAPSQTLYLSSSLRGSLFAFRLAFPTRALLRGQEADSDADFLALGAGGGRAGGIGEGVRVQRVRVQHVLEVPTEGRVLGFVLDDEPFSSSSEMGALLLHEGGVHQIVFSLPCPSSPEEGEEEGEQEPLGLEAPRRMSLESSILVSEEVQVVVDEADPLALSGGGVGGGGAAVNGVGEGRPRSSSFVANAREQAAVCTPIQEETPSISPPLPAVDTTTAPLDSPSAFLTSPTSPSSPSLHIPSSSSAAATEALATVQALAAASAQADNKPEIKLSGSAVNAAIRSMKAKNKGSTSPSPTPTSPSTTAGTRDPIANAWATGVAAPSSTSSAGKKGKKDEGSAEVLRELRKLEESLPGRIAKVVGKEMEKHAQRAEEDKLQDLAADTARQETMLKLVSTTLSKNTSRLVEAAIKEQVKHQVIPSIGKLVSAAVQEQIGRGVSEGMKEALPNEIEKLLYRPDLVAHLARNFSSTIAPSLERSLSNIVSRGVIPAFHSSLNGAIETCMKEVRREMVDVRKEIVKEQSGAVVGLEEEVHALRGDVVDLKAALERMEAVVLSLATSGGGRQPIPPTYSTSEVVASPATSQQAQHTPQHAQHQQPTRPLQQQQQRQVSGPAQALSPQHRQQPQQQSPYSLPPIPRVPTPPQAYEEMFTNALLPQHEPSFASLVHLINSSPPSRLESIFPPAPQAPKISPAVILSLAFRLSEVIASADGPLEDEGRRQLHWVRKCLTAMDGKSPELADFIPRILDSVITSLHNRCKRLHAIGDKRGMEEARTVEQYARAEQRLFSERARESFRR